MAPALSTASWKTISGGLLAVGDQTEDAQRQPLRLLTGAGPGAGAGQGGASIILLLGPRQLAVVERRRSDR